MYTWKACTVVHIPHLSILIFSRCQSHRMWVVVHKFHVKIPQLTTKTRKFNEFFMLVSNSQVIVPDQGVMPQPLAALVTTTHADGGFELARWAQGQQGHMRASRRRKALSLNTS